MPGHIQQKSGNWYVVLERGYHPETGKRLTPKWVSVRKELGLARPAKKKEAERLLNVLLAQEYQGQSYVSPSDMTLQEMVELWLPQHKQMQNLSHNAYEQYKHCSNKIVSEIGHLHIARITPAQIQSFLSSMGETYSSHTLHALGKTLNLIFKAAYQWGYVGKNPMERVNKPKLPANNIEYWTEEELQTFLRASRPNKYHPLFLLAATTGMRKSEITGLKQRYINWQECTITIEDAKTKSGWRTLDISPAVMEHLKTWKSKNELLFPAPHGGKMHKSNINKVMQAIIKKAGVRYITFHGLRHTYATIMLARGTNPVELAEILGHANPSLLWNTYAHLLPKKRKDNASRMDDLFLE